MNNNYKETGEKVTGSMNNAIADVLTRLNEKPPKDDKEGVSLLDITKKLSEKKFGKKKK